MRRCFPGAAVLVLGVSDRSVKTDAGFEPMDAIPCWRPARGGRNTGAAFWPTSDAMRAQGGIAEFVRNGWAGKDYTHQHAGGRRAAGAVRRPECRSVPGLCRAPGGGTPPCGGCRDGLLQRARIEQALLPAAGPETHNLPRP